MSLTGTGSATNLLRGSVHGLKTLTISAYAIAVQNGFEGTEEEWLESLKGDKGDPGDTPQKGIDYFDGEKGADGAPGDAGASIFYTGKDAAAELVYFPLSTIHTYATGSVRAGDLLITPSGRLYLVWKLETIDDVEYAYCNLKAKITTDGADGADGKSAYEVAVANGFEGTEEEWLESLKGESGSVTVDSEFSATSENPVQNKVITAAMNQATQIIAAIRQLPETTADDNGKILQVVDGAWAVVAAELGGSDETLIFDGVLTGEKDETTGEWDTLSFAEDTSDATLIVGKKYRYTIFGESYEAECFSLEEVPAIGNPAAIGGGEDNGQTCVIARDVSSGTPMWVCLFTSIPADYNGEVALQIYELGGAECKLPEVTEADNGKMLQCVDGAWAKVDDTKRVTDIVNAVIEEALGGDY